MDWLTLSLLCALGVAAADAATKHYLSDYRAREIVIVRFGACALVLSPFLLAQPLPSIAPPFWGWVAALVPLEVLAMLLYMRAIRDCSLALTLPYLAFTPVFVAITGYVLLGERVTAGGLSGIALVVVGAYLLNLDGAAAPTPRRWLAPLIAIARERGSRLMLGVAALYSLTSVMGKGALQYVPASFFGAFYFSLVAIAAIAFFSIREPRVGRVLWRRPGQHLLIGALMAIMVLSHFAALERIEVAYMITVKRTSLLFGILFGALLFGERHMTRHLLAGGLMVAGVGIIAFKI